MKQTVEEAARENILFNHRTADRTLSGKNLAQFGEINFIQGAEWHAKQSPWISVKGRLPEEDGYYFVTDGDVVEKVYFFKRWNKFVSTRDYPHLFYDEGVIKAWLPIPSFDEILEANRDVLERIKEKGD
ncbi:hypothetical protein K0F04_19795 [Bacteroides fragilis]|jgi:hypothetical protein|nr:hypothetical protein [Bacteroides fragilis]